MGQKVITKHLAEFSAWVLSLITLVAEIILLFMFKDPKGSNLSTIQIIGYVFCVFMIPASCFIICRVHPKSIWYTPAICNAVGVIAIFIYVFTDLSNLSELIFWIGSIVLSIIGAIAGAILGSEQLVNQNN